MADLRDQQQTFGRLDNSAKEAAFLRNNGQYAEAERLQRQIVREILQIRGLEDRATLVAEGQLALTLWHQGRHQEAAEKQKHIMLVHERNFGWDDADTLGIAGHLVTTYLSQGRDDEAKALATKLLHHRNRVYGENSTQARNAEEALAVIFHRRGKFAKAAEIRKRILDSVISRDEDPMRKASAFGAYGQTLMEQGKLDDAKPNLVQAVFLSKDTVGSEHPQTLYHQSTLAVLYFEMGDFHTAVAIGGEVLGNWEKSVGEEHHKTILSMSDQAACLLQVGRRDESKTQIDRAVRLARRHLGGYDSDRSSIFSNAASIYRALGLYRLSSELSFESYDSTRRMEGEDSPATLDAMMEYSLSLIKDGNLQMGREIMRLCVQRTERQYGSDHKLTVGRAKELANSYDERRNIDH
jgi:tetratricopeptide (TPR) repeat protein